MTQTATSVRLVALGLASFLVAVPQTAAAEPALLSAPRPIAASVPAAIAATRPAPKLLLAQATETAADAATSDDRPFLKTGKGRLAAGLVLIGTAFAIHSKFENRVKSPGR